MRQLSITIDILYPTLLPLPLPQVFYWDEPTIYRYLYLILLSGSVKVQYSAQKHNAV